jgi:hypothetical protein
MHVPAHPLSIVRSALAQRVGLAMLLIRTAGGSPALAQWTASDTHGFNAVAASERGLVAVGADGAVALAPVAVWAKP